MPRSFVLIAVAVTACAIATLVAAAGMPIHHWAVP